MSKAIGELKHEHEAILFSLGILEKLAGAARSGEEWDMEDSRELVGFLKEFADTCHHGKEEGILFPAMEKAGIQGEGGPIGAMLHEHALGRERIRGMNAALGGQGDRQAFAREASGYIELLRQHIEKENTILFSLGEKVLSPETLEGLYTRFEEHEERVMGHGRHEELHGMLAEFEKRYLPQKRDIIEKSYPFAKTDQKIMEKVIDDERVNINHIVVPAGEAVRTHVSNSFVHQIIVSGTLSLSLEDGPFADYPAGTMVAVPFNQKMAIENRGTETLEFFVVKAPNPRDMPPVKAL